ncbi:hypothetical protein THASP1DRAFT_32791 [Thamnocephalis sphaerospora]|uniref:PWI domain-containing protein n=1 Tax=Thamnocephalis sphaerospora TaxID=78915 RepID=A0A4V1IVV4_9FUNG|nr:hypothetical protein THASP1DRAFT_32791 [Thamnocephalis sphaerospora]|eukprot:RKP05369.1 hypothetical protein THASP1DRAFT_32791 [Thamnocephalis sphaerospora]
MDGRSRWRKQRQEIRQREQDMDDRARQREEQHALRNSAESAVQKSGAPATVAMTTTITASMPASAMEGIHPDRMHMLSDSHQAAHEAGQRPTSTRAADATLATPLYPSAPIKMSFSATKRANTGPATAEVMRTGVVLSDEAGETDDARKRRRLAPPPPMPRVEDPEERKRLIEKLVTRIPLEPADLWRWETALNDKLREFVAKKVEEILGVPEDELVTFVIDHLHKRGTPKALAEELEMALDEEAVRLVARLWRMLIYETEAYAQGLS